MQQDLQQVVATTGRLLLTRGWRLASAESCTGGGLAYTLTSQSGSSRWFECSFVTYSNQAKQQLLGVDESILNQHGAVSEAVVNAMSQGALQRCAADVSIAISGIAGPEGGSESKPVGTVWLSWFIAPSQMLWSERCLFDGDREAVRTQAILYALETLNQYLTENDLKLDTV